MEVHKVLLRCQPTMVTLNTCTAWCYPLGRQDLYIERVSCASIPVPLRAAAEVDAGEGPARPDGGAHEHRGVALGLAKMNQL